MSKFKSETAHRIEQEGRLPSVEEVKVLQREWIQWADAEIARLQERLEAAMVEPLETIYLIPGEWDSEAGLTACNEPAPTENHRPGDAVEYVRKDKCDARIAELEQCLKEARYNMEDWAGYASEYFREKHDLQGDLAGIDRVLGGKL